MDLLVDILIPTTDSPVSLSATLAALAGQRYPSFRVTAARPPLSPRDEPQLVSLATILEAGGHVVRFIDVDRPATEGGALQALVDQADAPYLLVVEDGVYLEPDMIGRLVAGLRATGGAFVGSNVVDLRFQDEHRPDEESIEFWDGPVRPEEIAVGSRAWERRRIHRGANLHHLRERLPRTRDRLYRVADIHGCVLYDAAKLRASGGFRSVLDHRRNVAVPAGRASAAQLRMLARHGGAGLFPSGAYRLAPLAIAGEDGHGHDAAPVGGRENQRGVAAKCTTRPQRVRCARHPIPRHSPSLPRRARRRHAKAPVPGRPRESETVVLAGGPGGA